MNKADENKKADFAKQSRLSNLQNQCDASKAFRDTLQVELGDDCRGNFFNGFGGRIEPLNTVASHQRFGVTDFFATVLNAGVASARAAFVSDFRQSFRFDGKSK